MKVIRLLFALYILAIAVYPCGDVDTCVDEQKVGIAVVEHENHSTTEQDACSPFCICSCCASHVQIRGIATLRMTNAIHNTTISTLYIEKPFLENGHSIWQPPRA